MAKRELTPTEVAHRERMQRAGFGLLTAAGGIVCMHVLLESARVVVWTQTTCTVELNDGASIAVYERDRSTYSFVVKAEPSTTPIPCWVPGPAILDNVGTLTQPPVSTVPLMDKLSFNWLFTALCSAALGVVFLIGNHYDTLKRRQGEISEDDFGPD